jgi:hypothetical protein
MVFFVLVIYVPCTKSNLKIVLCTTFQALDVLPSSGEVLSLKRQLFIYIFILP